MTVRRFDIPGVPKLPTLGPTAPSTPTPNVSGGVAIVGGALGGGIPVPSFMPPNGFAGLAQQTPAVQSLYRRGRVNGTRRRRKSATKSASPRRRRRSSKPMRLVKGSAAAKRYMAKIRRMRK